MGAKDKIESVVRDPAVYNISFVVGNVKVLGREFTTLLQQFKNLTLQAGIDPKIPTPADYDPVKNIIRLKSDKMGTDVGSRAAIAHECTHVYLSTKNVPSVTNEVAAFLVEVIYNLVKDPFRTRNSIQPNPAVPPATTGEKGIAQQALALIDKFQMDKRSCFLKPDDYKALGKAIVSVPNYSHLKLKKP